MLKLRKMELTELFSGFKNKRQKKMELLRVINGSHLQSMSETGVIIAKKASASSTIRTETSTKACGQLISATARELTGRMRTKR